MDGVVFWVYSAGPPLHQVVGFSVYDPRTGVWNYGSSDTVDTDVWGPTIQSGGGTITWQGFQTGIRFATYDPELNQWVINGVLGAIGSMAWDNTGAVAWQQGSGYHLAVYDPRPGRKTFMIGDTPAVSVPTNFSLANGTLSYTSSNVPATFGYNPASANWISGNTKPLAYYAPSITSGQVNLNVFFWDLSIGSTGWNYTFGDGGTSSVPNPLHTYQTAVGSPFTATLSVSGPGGSSSYSRTITTTTPHAISGNAANANGFKIPNATVTLSGTISRTTQTDSNGNYSFTNLTGNGNYTVTITKTAYAFAPPTRTFTSLSGSQTGSFVGKLNDKPSDFDGDGKTDVSIFRASNNEWWTLNSSTGSSVTNTFGSTSDKIVPRDYDGDGKTDIAVFRASTGEWYILRSSTATISVIYFGLSGDVPVPTDYDGDDKADAAIFRPSEGKWYVVKSSNGQSMVDVFGLSTDKMSIGDYDGDEKADVAIYRPSDSTWYVHRSSDSSVVIEAFGNTGDIPVQGDYDGDGKTDFATFRPGDVTWRIRKSSTATTTSQAWGLSTDNLAPGDYDGDGKYDFGVFRQSNGTWYAIRSSDQAWFAPGFGTSGDYPTPQSYIAE
ncbi:MAG: FG-GAP-like repeat-containing protein [Pyrinomonadaceae bacterium]